MSEYSAVVEWNRAAETVFGWMIHANVFLGDDLGTVFAHEH